MHLVSSRTIEGVLGLTNFEGRFAASLVANHRSRCDDYEYS